MTAVGLSPHEGRAWERRPRRAARDSGCDTGDTSVGQQRPVCDITGGHVPGKSFTGKKHWRKLRANRSVSEHRGRGRPTLFAACPPRPWRGLSALEASPLTPIPGSHGSVPSSQANVTRTCSVAGTTLPLPLGGPPRGERAARRPLVCSTLPPTARAAATFAPLGPRAQGTRALAQKLAFQGLRVGWWGSQRPTHKLPTARGDSGLPVSHIGLEPLFSPFSSCAHPSPGRHPKRKGVRRRRLESPGSSAFLRRT